MPQATQKVQPLAVMDEVVVGAGAASKGALFTIGFDGAHRKVVGFTESHIPLKTVETEYSYGVGVRYWYRWKNLI